MSALFGYGSYRPRLAGCRTVGRWWRVGEVVTVICTFPLSGRPRREPAFCSIPLPMPIGRISGDAVSGIAVGQDGPMLVLPHGDAAVRLASATERHLPIYLCFTYRLAEPVEDPKADSA